LLAGRCAALIVRAGIACYPLQAEAVLAGRSGAARATLFQDGGGRIVLLIEPAGDPGAVDIDALQSRISWCPPDEIVLVKAILLDHSQHPKVRYGEALRRLARGAWLRRIVLPRSPPASSAATSGRRPAG
jgi:hypothetical protein